MKVLLYSLDEAVLTRCAEDIKYPAPGVDAVRSSDHVGSAQLRQKARSADLVVNRDALCEARGNRLHHAARPYPAHLLCGRQRLGIHAAGSC
ncbi:hypothetical protein KVH02_20815 [Streptomyces olivaceus]|uniref:D-isomer specific 2-hydroxyacid dehydrogenase catalytic domain-containing protein n=1 Tax=Streptomyces olivaceus TaxID=47716 RepID=A0ABS7W5K8_STROV|nr:hypothetical protein [Streptomyces olivaceus]MBZ6090747.1 hypothetical protein [Streptomyces olivaceus]MBZ6096922.1 hypothetical protein [Streptomyces olivaceus]MBZ6119541.1 hypothetical protein [Streptomyces olivaceus]MBZ6153247.1 hypothetical protein [Streptomyces olivaceus]MBZ6299330.1 hypothetical protein [Streptomyces olivaceus]